MPRNFEQGRQNEVLLNEEHYRIFKVLEHFLAQSNPENSAGPYIQNTRDSEVGEKALWFDNFTDPQNADLKYFNGTNWELLFSKRFQLLGHLLENEQPKNPINSQLWIDDGVLKYYQNGQFNPVKAVPFDISNTNPLGFENFLIISPLIATENRVVDNFTQFLFAKPVLKWEKGKAYVIDEGVIFDLHVYKCIKNHTSSDTLDPTDKTCWVRLDYLNQYLVPNSFQDKFFIDGHYIHEKLGWTDKNNLPDPKDDGYTISTNVCVDFPVEMVNAKQASAIHVNPQRLNNIEKKFIKIDKENPVIEVPEENTEFYAVYQGLGKLLVKTENKNTTDYISVVSGNIKCIKLSENVTKKFDFIYAIHYDFISTQIKSPGALNKKKLKLNDDNCIWIGSYNPADIMVFAQGLYYENIPSNYTYDSESGYLYIKEKLQDNVNLVKSFDFSVLTFPKIYTGKVDQNMTTKGFRINLPEAPKSKHLIGFCAGVQLNMAGLDVLDDTVNNDPTVKYIPSIDEDMLEHTPDIYWAIAEVDEYDNEGILKNEMWRGKTKAINHPSYGTVVSIYRDKEHPVDGALYLGEDEYPIMFVDGILVFQKEIEISNNYLTIYGLKAGQEVVLLADKKTEQQSEYENSDRVIFEDSVSYATIPTELSDNTLVYVENGVLCDASAVYTSIRPKEPGYHGEIRLWIDYAQEQWLIYNAYTLNWEQIDENVMITDSFNGRKTLFSEMLDKNARSYSETRKSISFLQNLGNRVCTYYAYLYADSIEKPLQMEYCYPNGKDGVNNDYFKPEEPKPFTVNYKHTYTPGKNELTVYLNGVRQNLDSPYNINHKNSKNKECRTDRNNMFTLAIDDGTKMGKAIPQLEGYYTYLLKKGNKEIVKSSLIEWTDSEKRNYTNQGYALTQLSSPNKNVIFYVIERCETGETTACERKTLTYKDALSSKGAYANCTYDTGSFLLTRGNIRVFINGIRQPFGAYQTLTSRENSSRGTLEAYRIIDAKTIEIKDPLIGGMGGNEGSLTEPKFPIGVVNNSTAYYECIDEIIIETRRDAKLREITVPIKDNTGEFTEEDGLPADLFKSKDKIMIYINGLAYGKDYKIENGTLKLLNENITSILGNSKNDVITFEWR